MELTKPELATVLAALRHWQDYRIGREPDRLMLLDIASDGGRQPLMNVQQIDDLCRKLNETDLLDSPA